MRTVFNIRYTIVTIAAMMALGYITRYCGLDATLGLAFARTGALYPFFGTLIGWLGTASRAPTPPPMFFLEACKPSPPARSASRPCSWPQPTLPAVSWAR